MRTACGIFACSWLCEWLSPLNCLKARKHNESDESVRSVYARFGGLFVYQLVDQLRQDFEAAAACKCDTCKALGFPAFPPTNQKAGSSNPQSAPLLLESDSCSQMNIWCFSSFPSIPCNNRLSENFFDGITKPKPTQLSDYASSQIGMRRPVSRGMR